MIPPRPVLRVLWRVDRAVDRLTGGRFDRLRPGPATLRLITRGRRSGEPRVNGVYYVADGERWAVVPSNAGSTREPAWWLNLQADPNARVRVGTVEYAARARVATPDEERRLWPRLEAMLPAYREYRAVAGRAIPIVLLERGNGA